MQEAYLHLQLSSSLGSACRDGEEIVLPEDYWDVNEILIGPYLDGLGQRVYLCRVSGVDDHSVEVEDIIWEQQEVDMPPGMVSKWDAERAELGLFPDDLQDPPTDLVEEAYSNAYKHLGDPRVVHMHPAMLQASRYCPTIAYVRPEVDTTWYLTHCFNIPAKAARQPGRARA